MKSAPMLEKDNGIYTLKSFEEFHDKYEKYQGIPLKEHNKCHWAHKYKVGIFKGDIEPKVTPNMLEHFIWFDCSKFEISKTLCRYGLLI